MKENKRKAAQDTLCTKSNACILNKNVPGDFEQGRHFVYSVLPVPVCPLSVVISSVPAERTFSIKGAVENSAVKKMTRILSFWYICSELSLKISQKVVFPIKPTKLHKQAFVVGKKQVLIWSRIWF